MRKDGVGEDEILRWRVASCSEDNRLIVKLPAGQGGLAA